MFEPTRSCPSSVSLPQDLPPGLSSRATKSYLMELKFDIEEDTDDKAAYMEHQDPDPISEDSKTDLQTLRSRQDRHGTTSSSSRNAQFSTLNAMTVYAD